MNPLLLFILPLKPSISVSIWFNVCTPLRCSHCSRVTLPYRIAAEAVHLGQDLVERLLLLVVAALGPATRPGPALCHGVNLVDEDDARTVLLGLWWPQEPRTKNQEPRMSSQKWHKGKFFF
jgi:hypothetical protein